MSSALLLKNVSKSFGSKVVLEGVDLEVKRGESLVIIGGSGTGKSVLLKCILGLLEADSGSILIEGQEVVGASQKSLFEIRSQIGMLFQGSALFDSLPVWENIFFGLLQKGLVSPIAAREKVGMPLGAVGLKEDVADLYPAELSGGMQRRVALARAVVGTPDILFFDEPTTGLDPIMSGVIADLILKNVKELGATAVTITHDMITARKIADRVAMIYQGKILWQGPVSDLDQSGNPFLDQFVHGKADGPIWIEGR